jgi:predicted PurR-regulated permease PerM
MISFFAELLSKFGLEITLSSVFFVLVISSFLWIKNSITQLIKFIMDQFKEERTTYKESIKELNDRFDLRVDKVNEANFDMNNKIIEEIKNLTNQNRKDYIDLINAIIGEINAKKT